MNVTDRYLGAVRWNLPAAKADDIVAELADLIAARIEDREEQLGRPLSQGEINAVLRDFGHPLAVAGQYHGQRSLIGPEVFPFYWFVLKIVLALVLVIELIQFGGRLVVGDADLIQAAMQGVHDAGQSLLLNAAMVTLAFAVIERTGWLTSYLERWKPEELPDFTKLRLDLPPRKRWETVFEIAFGLGFLAWWMGAFEVPIASHDDSVRIVAAPVWTMLYWPVVALVAARVLLSVIGFVRPAWKPLRAALILGCAGCTLAIAKVLHEAGQLVLVTSVADPDKAARVQESLDKSFEVAVIAVAVITVWQCAKELWQLHKERR